MGTGSHEWQRCASSGQPLLCCAWTMLQQCCNDVTQCKLRITELSTDRCMSLQNVTRSRIHSSDWTDGRATTGDTWPIGTTSKGNEPFRGKGRL
jgi:hypothetical protein